MRPPLRLLLPLLVALAVPTAARADAVDLALVRDAEAIAAAVRKLGTRSVSAAVLRFEVQVGDGPATRDAGLASAQLPQRLENLLVLAGPADNSLLVLTNTDAAARKAGLSPTADWRDAAVRKKIAALTGLTLAWEVTQTDMVPTAFVTGRLELSADLAAAKLTLYGFTRANPDELKTLYTSPDAGPTPTRPAVVADRSVLAMAGVSYTPDPTADGKPVSLLANKDFATVVGRSPVKLDMYISDRRVEPEADPTFPGGGRLKPGTDPKAVDKVYFILTNAGTTDYAVVLAVNGRNTNAIGPDPLLTARPPADQRKWLLQPGKSIRLDGYYINAAGKYEPFTVLDDAVSAADFVGLSERYRGLVTLHVYGPKPPVPAPPTVAELMSTDPVVKTAAVEKAREQQEEEESTTISLGFGGSAMQEVRSATNPEEARQRLQTLAGVRLDGTRLAANTMLTSTERGLIGSSGETKAGGPIEKVSFEAAPHPTAFLQIRYYGGN